MFAVYFRNACTPGLTIRISRIEYLDEISNTAWIPPISASMAPIMSGNKEHPNLSNCNTVQLQSLLFSLKSLIDIEEEEEEKGSQYNLDPSLLRSNLVLAGS